VNVLVDNSHAQGAPAVIEHEPTYYNLFGRIDYRSWLGGMVTERRGGRRVIDLKQGGLLAVTDLARVAAIRCGLEATATLERLHGSVTGGSLEGGAARALEEAFETFNELRIDRQVQCVRTGEAVDAYVEPASLDPVSRSRLRQAFRVVDAAQARLHAELGGGRIR